MERNVVFCLLCSKAQKCISSHLTRVCLKNATPEEREREASRAIASQRMFGKEGRVWDFSELEEYCKDAESCIKLCGRLQSRGLIVINTPQICPTVLPKERSKKDVLAAAQQDIEFLQQRLMDGDSISKTGMTTFRQYCEAILLLEHGLTGNAVVELCVHDWIERKAGANGAVIELSSTAVSQTFTISNQEEELLECYLQSIRPVSLKNQGPGSDDRGKFFLGESGLPLSNPAADLRRLKAKYLPDESEAAASGSASEDVPATGEASTSGQSRLTPFQQRDAFFRSFPVTLNGDPPTKEECLRAGFPCYRPLYHKWRELQLAQRTQHILGLSVSRKGNPPQAARIKMNLEKEAWTSNIPTAEDISKAWVPPQAEIKDSEAIIASISEQKWKGLALKDFGEEKKKGVIAVMPFSKGDVVCDYHGTLVSEAEGKQRPPSGYLFFFRGERGRGLCIDSSGFPCACHPDKDTYGRRLNHSRRSPNIRPQKHTINLPAGPKETILFIALRDIRVGEELLWDYGVTRKSFGGEGEDLEWLDT